MRPSEIPVKDRRIQKTLDLLHRALAALIHEKPYDSISVKEILDRANVGRSTFYTHFRDKDELLVKGIHDVLRSVQSEKLRSSAKMSERIISFSLPLFEHIAHHRRTGDTRMGARGRVLLHDHLRELLAESIADDIRKCLPGQQETAGRISMDLLSEYLSSTFILVLNWWVESRSELSPRDINEVFRTLVLPAAASGLKL